MPTTTSPPTQRLHWMPEPFIGDHLVNGIPFQPPTTGTDLAPQEQPFAANGVVVANGRNSEVPREGTVTLDIACNPHNSSRGPSAISEHGSAGAENMYAHQSPHDSSGRGMPPWYACTAQQQTARQSDFVSRRVPVNVDQTCMSGWFGCPLISDYDAHGIPIIGDAVMRRHW